MSEAKRDSGCVVGNPEVIEHSAVARDQFLYCSSPGSNPAFGHSGFRYVHLHFSGDGKIKVIDGPFAETKELIAGFCVIQAKSLQEAIEWAKRAPDLHTGQESHIEVREFFELAQIAKVG